jgi:hypothetical protein
MLLVDVVGMTRVDRFFTVGDNGMSPYETRCTWIACLLVPFNLHVLFLGHRSYMTGSLPMYENFCFTKALRAGLESLPLAVVTLIALEAGWDARQAYTEDQDEIPEDATSFSALWAAIGISILSMAYGFALFFCQIFGWIGASRFFDALVFALIDSACMLLACAHFLAEKSFRPYSYYILAAVLLVLNISAFWREYQSQRSTKRWVGNSIFIFLFSVIVGLPFYFLDAIFGGSVAGFETYTSSKILHILLRRTVLVVFAIAPLIKSYNHTIFVWSLVLGALHMFSTCRFYTKLLNGSSGLKVLSAPT